MPPLENPRIFYLPEQQTAKNIRDYVSLAGSHPVLNPDGSATADPLVIRPVADIKGGLINVRPDGTRILTISVSDLNKAGLEGGKPYTISIPTPLADVELDNPWRQTTFVGYLRSAFKWGRFPGGTRLVAAARHDRRTY